MPTLYTGTQCPDSAYLHTPLIEICRATNQEALHIAAQQVTSYDYLLFTSRYAVKYWAEHCNMSILPCKPIVVSIGSATTQALLCAGANDVVQVEHDDSYGVVQWFSNQPRGKVFIPRSNIALPIIPNELQDLGFSVSTIVAYENQIPHNVCKVDLSTIERIIFTSPSTVRNFIQIYGSLPTDKQIVARGAITQEYIDRIRANS